jgi:hypothetical protein
MAQIRTLLALGRRSDRRWSAGQRSGGEKALEAIFSVGCALAMYRQLSSLISGDVPARLTTEHRLVLVLCIAWIAVPLTIRPSIPVTSLAAYPLTFKERARYALASYFQNMRLFAVAVASILTLAAELSLPSPLLHALMAVAWFLLSAAAGLGLALISEGLQMRSRTFRKRGRPVSHPLPMVRKEVAYFRRTLDPYVVLLLSGVAGYSEFAYCWITPPRLLAALLLIAAVQSSAVLNPFALDTLQERERYRLFPISYRRIIFYKHVALVLIFAVASIPLAAAVAYRTSLVQWFAVIMASLMIMLGWCCSGLLLMHTPSALRVRMAFGTLSGEGMSIALALGCAVLMGMAPVLVSLVSLRYPHLKTAALSSAVVLLAALYGTRLRSLSDWDK